MQKILDLQKEMGEAEAELVEVLHPAKTRKPREAKSAASGAGSNGNGGVVDWDKRGALVEALRKVIQMQRGEWTRQLVVEKAGVPAGRENSAKAALSRMMKDGVIEAGVTPGTYRTKEVQR
jgi:hypothetical protein